MTCYFAGAVSGSAGASLAWERGGWGAVSAAGFVVAALGAVCSVSDGERLDPRVLARPVAAVGGQALELVDDVHAARDLAEDGVLAVEPGG